VTKTPQCSTSTTLSTHAEIATTPGERRVELDEKIRSTNSADQRPECVSVSLCHRLSVCLSTVSSWRGVLIVSETNGKSMSAAGDGHTVTHSRGNADEPCMACTTVTPHALPLDSGDKTVRNTE